MSTTLDTTADETQPDATGPLLDARDVVKRFQGVTALDGAALQVAPSEIHALLGGNGAGKSTLINVLSGIFRPDNGTVTLDGQELHLRRPSDARDAGITTVFQELSLVPALTALDNIYLGREASAGVISAGVRLDRRTMAQRVVALAAEFGITEEDLSLPVGEFGALKKRVVEIVKALATQPRLLILDEPTSGLEDEEKQHLFGHMRRLRAQGVSLVWVTHHLEELEGLADTVTVYRDGANAGTVRMPDTSVDELVGLMFGAESAQLTGDVIPPPAVREDESSAEVLRLEGVTRGTVLRDISMSVRAGEVVGISGLAGAGRTELARVIMGLDRPSSGQIWVKGKLTRMRNPSAAYRKGLAMVPEDRKQLGILADLSVAQNISISNLAGVSRFGFIVNPKLEKERGETFRKRLRIRTPSVEERIGNLSGGNQQKAVVARCLNTDPALVVFDEPTQGVDVHAKVEVHNLIREFVESGGAAIVIASEVDELVDLSHRVLIMRQGRLVGQVDEVGAALAEGRGNQLKHRILTLSARSEDT
jgi:ABC-type sugar transport system ATPase subunit